MTKKEAIKIFEEKKVRTLWDDETEEWYFSIVDVVSVLTGSVDGRKYWNKLKQRLKADGSELGHSVISPLNAKMELRLDKGDDRKK